MGWTKICWKLVVRAFKIEALHILSLEEAVSSVVLYEIAVINIRKNVLDGINFF